tara:strand:+ start:258 stop:884 length:627 start_codon:yes stop_codon:yes gene_type:complete
MKKINYNKKTINGNFVDNRYDDMKTMLDRVRLINEQAEGEVETATQDEDEPRERPTVEEELTKEYTVSGGKIIVHGASEQDLVLTDEEKSSFQETMEQFAEEVSDMAQFHPLNIYKNNVEWSGDLLRFDVRFYYSIAEVEGTYIGNANMIKVDNKFMEVLEKVKSFYNTFESKWAKVLADRRTTEVEKEEGLGDDELAVDVEMDSGIE